MIFFQKSACSYSKQESVLHFINVLCLLCVLVAMFPGSLVRCKYLLFLLVVIGCLALSMYNNVLDDHSSKGRVYVFVQSIITLIRHAG